MVSWRRGKAVGRPRKLSPHQLARARALIEAGEETRAGVAELFGVDHTCVMDSPLTGRSTDFSQNDVLAAAGPDTCRTWNSNKPTNARR
ncbi:MAG: helix-turn-helix domain-containing protein [Chthoniobacterales bacterium]|nr:helix-turn-helix domain-containing protein [Chthoniobacterales bacterium]